MEELVTISEQLKKGFWIASKFKLEQYFALEAGLDKSIEGRRGLNS
jgi:hypothetical protein